jgi:hypothetical protein
MAPARTGPLILLPETDLMLPPRDPRTTGQGLLRMNGTRSRDQVDLIVLPCATWKSDEWASVSYGRT